MQNCRFPYRFCTTTPIEPKRIKAQAQCGDFSVVRAFSGASILLTGGTGYVGKLVLEQLFRTCPDLREVFLVIRPSTDRKGNVISPQERLQRLLRGPEFALLHDRMDSVLARCTVIPADLSMPCLGLSQDECLSLKTRTEYVIHCAASIRFDEPISEIMRTNFASTEQLLRLASGMPNLRCFTYMSTAYVNSNQPRHSQLREEIYPLPGTPDPLAEARTLLELPAREADRKVKVLMKQWGLMNTYFVAKTLSERLVMSFHGKPFPVCIVRPSLIGCVASDPYPGYIGNSSGFTAMILGSLAGIVKCIQHKPNHTIAVVPGDVVSSATLVATAATAQAPGSISSIVHICSSNSYPLVNKHIHTAVGGYLALDPVLASDRTLVRDGNYSVDWVRHRSVFAARCLGRKVKLGAMCAALRLAGQSRNANKISMAHAMWSKLGSSSYDYNFTFLTPTTTALFDMLPKEEKLLLKPIWREDLGDSWIRYLRTYTAGVKHIYLKEAPLLTDQQAYNPRPCGVF